MWSGPETIQEKGNGGSRRRSDEIAQRALRWRSVAFSNLGQPAWNAEAATLPRLACLLRPVTTSLAGLGWFQWVLCMPPHSLDLAGTCYPVHIYGVLRLLQQPNLLDPGLNLLEGGSSIGSLTDTGPNPTYSTCHA